MAFQCFVDTFNMVTTGVGTTIVRTGYGFTPKACLYWWTGRAEPGSATFATATLQAGFGMAASPTSRACVSSYSQTGAATMITNRRHDNANCVATSTWTGTVDAVDGSADLQSFDSASGGGQTLVITDAFGTTPRIHCLALGGSDLTNVAVVQFQTPNVSGAQTQDITTVGFQPDALLFMTAEVATAPPAILASGGGAALSLGMTTGASAQGMVSFTDADNQASSITNRYAYGGECLSLFAGFTSPSRRATLDSFLSNGLRLNWLEHGGTSQIYCWALCLKGGSFTAGNFLTSTTLNATIVESGLGFAPTGCLLMSHSDVQSTQDTSVAQANLSLGAFTSTTNRAAQSLVSNNAANSAVCASSLNEDACLRMLNNGTTSAGVVDVSAVGSNGFTLTMDVADVTTAKYVTYLAFGTTPALPAGARTPPTFVQEVKTTAWQTPSTTAAFTTPSFNVQAGDVLVACMLTNWNSGVGTLTASGGGLTWSEETSAGQGAYGLVTLAVATVDTTKSMTVTVTRSVTGANAARVALSVMTFRGVEGIGSAESLAVTTFTTVPELALRTDAANSVIVLANVDQRGLDGSTRAWLSNAGSLTETTYDRSAGGTGFYLGYHADSGAVSVYTVGMSAPANQTWACAALELYGPLVPVGGGTALLPAMMQHAA
jgi:hypothetical protein